MAEEEIVTTQNFDPWSEDADTPPDEAPPQREDLPPDVWCAGHTVTLEDGLEWAKPISQARTSKKTGEVFRIFKFALMCHGGEGKLERDKHERRVVRKEAFISPSKRELDNAEKAGRAAPKVSGQFMGALNALFSPGVGDDLLPVKGDSEDTRESKARRRTQARWAHTKGVLREVAEGDPQLTLEGYEGDLARLYCGTAVAALEHNSHPVLFKTRRGREYTAASGDKVRPIEAGMLEDFTPANREKRKVKMFRQDEADEGGFGFDS